jgi:hypothetical protein
MDTRHIADLPDHDRYKYLINHVVKYKEIWLLKARDGFYAMFEDSAGKSYIPVWPDKESADQYAIDDWHGYVSESMDLKELLEWMNELKEDQIMIGAFPNPKLEALAVDPLDFRKQLLELSPLRGI